jgi:CubicO group peptidase (beta-lactamase class C family)
MNLFLIMLLLVSFLNCKKGEGESTVITKFERYIQDEVGFQKIPAMSILVFKGDEILYEKYVGKSNLQQDVSLGKDHLFLLASISKVVTATALLQLYEDGYFALDDNINDYLPFNVNVPNFATNITFRMLLTHTSGIADGRALDDQYYYGEDSPIALDSFLENYLVPGGDYYDASENFHNFQPGTQHQYSNEGSALIGVLVEEISGDNFNTYCKQNIFNPLGMSNTYWRLGEITQPIAQPYNYNNGQYQAVQHYTFTDYPNGGLRSTGRDLFKILSAFVQNGRSNHHQLLSDSTINSILSPQIPLIDNEVGLHMFLMNSEHGLWGHDGGEEGAATIMGFNPTTKIGAIILANQGDADLDEILGQAYKLGLKL